MTSYSGLFDGVHGETYQLLSNKSPNRYHLARIFRKRGMRVLAELMDTALDDSTPASSASQTKGRVTADANVDANVQGGVRAIETFQQMGELNPQKETTAANTARAIDADDVTDLQLLIQGGSEQLRAPATYPIDKSGNGGGGKLS